MTATAARDHHNLARCRLMPAGEPYEDWQLRLAGSARFDNDITCWLQLATQNTPAPADQLGSWQPRA
ncbi:MAG: hypothetical protein QM779_11725 [Propionicimonas sp.]|uniref:hypothetical protein n=1 Tax=Propionicimonas sp. TaxID=1955623 RepID=UPI003D0A6102